MQVKTYVTVNRWPNTPVYSCTFASKAIAVEASKNLVKELSQDSPKDSFTIEHQKGLPGVKHYNPCYDTELPRTYWHYEIEN